MDFVQNFLRALRPSPHRYPRHVLFEARGRKWLGTEDIVQYGPVTLFKYRVPVDDVDLLIRQMASSAYRSVITDEDIIRISKYSGFDELKDRYPGQPFEAGYSENQVILAFKTETVWTKFILFWGVPTDEFS
jgi:hypothetical protein